MKNNIVRFALIASLILNVTVLATAGYMYYQRSSSWVSPFGVKIKKDRFLFDELSLRPEQREAMKARALPFRAEIDKRRQEIASKRKDLITLLRADKPDKKAIDAVITRISAMQKEMQQRITGHMLEEKSLLDKDQQQQFLDLIEKHMTRGGHGGCPPAEQGR